MKHIFYLILNKLSPLPLPVYGKVIFEHRSWLGRKVNEELTKQARDRESQYGTQQTK